jgi:hypothetical protein
MSAAFLFRPLVMHTTYQPAVILKEKSEAPTLKALATTGPAQMKMWVYRKPALARAEKMGTQMFSAATASREIGGAADQEATGAKTGRAITSCVVAVKVETSCKMVQVKVPASAAAVDTEHFIAS